MQSAKEKCDRLAYIEPTNIGNIGDFSNTINFPYEDYGISVDLKVRITDRFSCGWGLESGEIKELTYSSKEGTISLGGSKVADSKENYLTTNFTDISMISPSTNTSECLGIESISIAYGQWMFPQVVIKFVDVRGATVMMPSENNYYNGSDVGSSSEIYKSLFSFPYPMFELKVKGFYGKGVTYKLTVQKTDLEFNNETGNFNITVTFIGYMYGIYADMPMTYLAAAPYMAGGREYWNANIKNGLFRFRDASGQYVKPMMTIPELRDKLAKAANNFEAIKASSEGQQVSDGFDNKIKSLKYIEDAFPFKANSWFFETTTKTYYSVVKDVSNIKLIREQILEFINTIKVYDEEYNKTINEKYYSIFEILNQYIETYSSYHSSGQYNLNYSTDYVLSLADFSLKYNTSKGLDKEYSNHEQENTIIQISPSLNEFIRQKSNGIDTYFVVFIKTESEDGFASFMKTISSTDDDSIISSLLKAKEKQRQIYKQKELSIIEQIIGFRPSIRNIFNLIFAHMDTFMHCFYNSTKNIRKELEDNSEFRQKKYYNLNNGETDTEENINPNSSYIKRSELLPPYFGYYKKEEYDNSQKQTFKWPGDLSNGSDLEEVSFIYDLLDGAQLYFEESVTLEKTSGSTNDGYSSNITSILPISSDIKSFIPLTNYDLIFKDKIINPYLDVRKDILNGTDDMYYNILGIFGLRAFYYLCSNFNSDEGPLNNPNKDEAISFGILEALNLYKCIEKNISLQFKKFIENSTFDDLYKVNNSWGLTSETSPLFSKIGKNTNYSIGSYYPIGEFNPTNMKKDLQGEKLKLNEKYLDIISGNSENTFYLIEDKNYFKNVYTNLNNEIERLKNELKSENKDTESFKIIKTNKVLNGFIDNMDNWIDYQEIALSKTGIIEDLNGKKIDKVKYIQLLKDTKEKQEQYYIRYPFKNNFNISTLKEEGLNIYDKALLFLENTSINGVINKECNNSLMLKLSLLKEGAYYWKIDDTNDLELEKLIPSNYSISRKNILKEFFKNWADDIGDYGFKRNIEYLVNINLYGVNNKGERDYSCGLDIEQLKNSKAFNIDNKLQSFLRNLFFDIYTVIDFYDTIKKESFINFSQPSYNIKIAFDSFIRQLKKIYKGELDEINSNPISYIKKKSLEDSKNPFINDDVRLSTYMTLKSLYDKWLCSPERGALNTWSLMSDESDFNNFIYVDTYYHDIGDRLTVNISKISSWLSSCLPTSNLNSTEGAMTYTGKTIYEFLTSVSQDSGGMLLALPHKIGTYDNKSVEEMFTPMPLYSNWDNDTSTFVFMYTYKPSEHLGDSETSKYDMNGYSREGDGIDLNNNAMVKSILGDEGYTVPAFGVTYARQNQSIFKNIRLSTESAGVTEAGLAATFNIASKESDSPRETTLYGQDLYRVYSQYSYKCSAECMGNMQITPLMYFQLNNIPLWKGAYQIYKVSHEITAGNISTQFEGMRVNKYAIPLTSDVVITGINDGLNYIDSSEINNYDGITQNVGDMYDVEPNFNIKLGTIDFKESNITKEKPLICLTPAHGPKTKKREEWVWSSKVVDKIIEIFRSDPKKYKFYDGTLFIDNIQRCNKGGANTNNTGYNTTETQKYIQKFGSNRVISAVPHWNGGGGQYHWTMVDRAKTGVRQDSMRLAECMQGEFLKIKEEMSQDEEYKDMFKGDCIIDNMPENVIDGAPTLKCACVLTENWFADYSDKSKNWLNGNGIDKIAQAHADAIKTYIYQLIPPTKV